MNRRKGTFQSENQLPEKISGSYFPSENSLQKADEFSLNSEGCAENKILKKDLLMLTKELTIMTQMAK